MVQRGFLKLLSGIGSIIKYVAVTHCALEYGGDLIVCNGPSMEPTLFTNDVIFTEHITPRLHRLKKYDIVIVRSPSQPLTYICKRITATEGETIRHRFKTYVIPKGHVWLEGDNSLDSADSRDYGPVPEGLIKSRVICRVWPFENMTMLTRKNIANELTIEEE